MDTHTSHPQPPSSPSPEDKEPEKKKNNFDNFKSSFSDAKKGDKMEELVSFAKENKRDTIAYVAMIIGVLFMFFDSTSLVGSLIVGAIFSLYFMDELYHAAKNIPTMAEEHGMVKVFVMAGTLLALFFRAPFLFVAIAIVLGVKMIIFPEKKAKNESKS